MKLHEYQAKNILKKFNIPVPNGFTVETPEEAKIAASDLGQTVVVKAQVHAGGRGKAGGVKVVHNPEDAQEAAKSILGSNLVTFQTGPEGVPVQKVLIEQGIDIHK